MKAHIQRNKDKTTSRLYSDAVKAGNHVYLSGQVALNEKGELVGKNDIEAQTRQVMKNIQGLLVEVGASLEDVVKITVYLRKLEDRPSFHKIRSEFFGSVDKLPASTLVVVDSLANQDWLVEVDAIAVVD